MLTTQDQARLCADAQYIASRVLGASARPPEYWTPQQIAAFARLFADPAAKVALAGAMLNGFPRQLVTQDQRG